MYYVIHTAIVVIPAMFATTKRPTLWFSVPGQISWETQMLISYYTKMTDAMMSVDRSVRGKGNCHIQREARKL
jgi:hypothetical protein